MRRRSVAMHKAGFSKTPFKSMDALPKNGTTPHPHTSFCTPQNFSSLILKNPITPILALPFHTVHTSLQHRSVAPATPVRLPPVSQAAEDGGRTPLN